MAATLLLDTTAWDLSLNASGNIAISQPPADGGYAYAQDAASAIKTFLGECWWDTTVGVPWLTQVLGLRPSLALLKQLLINAALTVSGVASAAVYITAFSNRQVQGQVQVLSDDGQISATNFTVTNPQGAG